MFKIDKIDKIEWSLREQQNDINLEEDSKDHDLPD